MHVMRKYNAKPQRICIFFIYAKITKCPTFFEKNTHWFFVSFYFLITYGGYLSVLYVLEDRTNGKEFPSVCLYVRTWTFHVDTITFEGVSGSKQNLAGVFYV